MARGKLLQMNQSYSFLFCAHYLLYCVQDTERRIVIGMRVGPASLPIRFRWYTKSAPVGKEFVIELNHGDLYVMSDKATGHDWMCPSKMTLRHGVGLKAPELEEGARKRKRE